MMKMAQNIMKKKSKEKKANSQQRQEAQKVFISVSNNLSQVWGIVIYYNITTEYEDS